VLSNSVQTLSGTAMRRLILHGAKRAHVGHIGSALSVADVLAMLYGGALRMAGPDDPARDRFVLSKGHAALALYAAMHLRQWLSAEDMAGYCTASSLLGVHPSHEVPGIEMSTGSLGYGLSYGAGMAVAAGLDGASWRVAVLLSDAECNEGSVWEAAMFAAHHRLANLTAIIDLNGQQALGRTRDILDLADMAKRWRAVGWIAHDVDGHDPVALRQAYDACAAAGDAPQVIVAHTVFGKGVSFMERALKWHYAPMSDAEFAAAIAEVEAS
jgi:transketolase